MLDTQTDMTAWTANTTNTYAVATPAAYLSYRLNVTQGIHATVLTVAQVELSSASANSGVMTAGTGAWTAPDTAGSVLITATSLGDPTKSSSTLVTVVAVPTTPTVTTTAYVTAAQAGYTASVSSQTGSTYALSLIHI